MVPVGYCPRSVHARSFFTAVDFDSVIDEPSPNGVLGFVDSAVERLPLFDQRTKLPMLG